MKPIILDHSIGLNVVHKQCQEAYKKFSSSQILALQSNKDANFFGNHVYSCWAFYVYF